MLCETNSNASSFQKGTLIVSTTLWLDNLEATVSPQQAAYSYPNTSQRSFVLQTATSFAEALDIAVSLKLHLAEVNPFLLLKTLNQILKFGFILPFRHIRI